MDMKPNQLLSLAQVASILNISRPRVYQMDDVLKPEIAPRGAQHKTRRYRPDVVELVRASRQVTHESPSEEREWRRHCRSAAANDISHDLVLEDYVHVASLNCLFCGAAPTNHKVGTQYVALHNVIRVVHSEGFTHDNSAPCCLRCEATLGTMDVREYIAHCRQVVNWQTILGFF